MKLYDSGQMSIGGNRGRVIVSGTKTGYRVETHSLYNDESSTRAYYKGSSLPMFPEKPLDTINDYGTTEIDRWLYQAHNAKPYRVLKD